MAQHNYRHKLLDLVEELQHNDRIDVEDYAVRDPLSKEAIAEAEKRHGMRLPANVSAFYTQVNGFLLNWVLREGEAGLEPLDPNFPDELWGSVQIYELEVMLGGRKGALGWHDVIWFDHFDAETKAERQRLRPFDMYDEDDAGAACFRLSDSQLESRLLLHSVDDGVMRMGIGLPTYVELLLQSRGLIGWQEAYVLPGSVERSRFLHYMPQLFPDADLKRFRRGE